MAVWELLMLITWVFLLVWGIPITLILLGVAAAIRKGKAQLAKKFQLEDDGA